TDQDGPPLAERESQFAAKIETFWDRSWNDGQWRSMRDGHVFTSPSPSIVSFGLFPSGPR
ncbi:MAG: hypothetical protein O7D91_04260, partial [Planctomycetota bacterium]|nr:hypothetical protein [Planctomycetota bacterium]